MSGLTPLDGSGVVCRVKNSFLHFEEPEPAAPQALCRSNSWSVSSSTSWSDDGSSSSHSHSQLRARAIIEDPPRQDVEASDVAPDVQRHGAETVAFSLGSSYHDAGQCRPCRFLSKGCSSGAECSFCHHPDHGIAGSEGHRPSKGVRNGYKKSICAITNLALSQEEKRNEYIALASRGHYMRHLLKDLIPDIEDIYERSQSAADAAAEIQQPGLINPGRRPPGVSPPEVLTPGLLNPGPRSQGSFAEIPRPESTNSGRRSLTGSTLARVDESYKLSL